MMKGIVLWKIDMPDYQREEQERRRKLLGFYDEEKEPFRMTTGNSLKFPDED